MHRWALKVDRIAAVGGTLKPLATGLMVLCLGEATRFTPVFQVGGGSYRPGINSMGGNVHGMWGLMLT